jgi:hypothetical protein
MAAIVAAFAVIGGAIGAVYVWQISAGMNPPPETTLIFGVFTGLIGTGSTFLFMSDAGSRAAHATERAATAGAVSANASAQQGAAQALAVPRGPVPPIVDPIVPPAGAGVPGEHDPDFEDAIKVDDAPVAPEDA